MLRLIIHMQAFLIICFVGVASSLLILPPNRVIRGDGTLVKLQARSSVGVEIREMVKLFTNWKLLALMPMFFASNYLSAYSSCHLPYLDAELNIVMLIRVLSTLESLMVQLVRLMERWKLPEVSSALC